MCWQQSRETDGHALPTSSPRRRVRKEFESEYGDGVGGLFRRPARARPPPHWAGPQQPARFLSWQFWKCLLSWFSQIQRKSRPLPVRGARCCASRSRRTVLRPQRLGAIILQGARRPALSRGFLPRSQLPAGLTEAIWGVVCVPARSLSAPRARRGLEGRPWDTRVFFLYGPPIPSPVAHRPKGTPRGAASLRSIRGVQKSLRISPRLIYPNN